MKFPRFRLSSFKGALDYFDTISGFRACMNVDGSGSVEVNTKDSAGRKKRAEVKMSTDDMIRLHHSLGEALKARGVYIELED